MRASAIATFTGLIAELFERPFSQAIAQRETAAAGSAAVSPVARYRSLDNDAR
jgi:hypothetical protein